MPVMAKTLKRTLLDLRLCSSLVILIIIKETATASGIPKQCLATEKNFDGPERCKPCFQGDCCEQKAIPKFLSRTGKTITFDGETLNDGNVNGVIYKVSATDADTCSGVTPCGCAEVEYSLDDDLGMFNINQVTGEIRVKGTSKSKLKSRDYHLNIEARNKDGSEKGSMELKIKSEIGPHDDFSDPYNNNGYDNDDDFSGHRRRREIPTSIPGNVTFDLIKKAPNANLTEMRVGQKIGFQLTITFPSTETNMLVELFTPDNDTIVMMLCGVTIVSKGTNLVFTETSIEPELHSIDNNLYYDRAVINFGNVTNSNAANSVVADNQVVIDYEAIMLDTVPTNGSTYWVSAGAEYNYEADVWVGQASFVCITDPETNTGTPTVNFTGPSSLSIGSSAVFTVDMFIPYPAVELSFDAFAPLNTSNAMSICAVKGKDVAVNYECGFDLSTKTATLHQEGNIVGNARGHLEIGKVYNKGARDAGNPDENNRITVEFVAHLFNDDTLIGNKYWLGAAVEIGVNQIWAGQIEVEAIAAPTGGPAVTPTFNQPTLNTPGSKTSQTKPVLIEAEVVTQESTSASYKLEVKGPAGQELQICSISVASAGEHLPCVYNDKEAEYNKTNPDGHVVDIAILDLGPVTNTGQWGSVTPAAADANSIKFNILVKASNLSVATSNYNVEVGLYVNDASLSTQTVAVTVEAAGTAVDIANETVPTMKMEFPSLTDQVPIGGATKVVLEMTTARGVLLPVMDIEFIMPNDTASDGFSPVTICRTEIVSVGKNLPCANKQIANGAITYDHKYEEGLSDRSVLSMGSLCNFEVVNDTAEDVMRLESVVQFNKDHSTMTNGSQHWISGGVMFSTTMMWVGQLAGFSRDDMALDPATTPHIEVITNSSAETPLGYSAVYTLVIKTGSNDHAAYSVNVTATPPELSICSVRMIAKGHHMPCVKDDAKNDLTKDSTGRNEKAGLHLGVVSNVGSDPIVANGIFDDNTLMVEVVVQLAKTAVTGSPFTFNIDTIYGTGAGTTVNRPVDVTPTSDMSAAANLTSGADPTIEIGMLPITETDNVTTVIKGQAKKVFLDIFVPLGSTHDLVAKVLAPIDKSDTVEINYIGIREIGENLPCLSRSSTTADYINRTTTVVSKHAIASLSLGVVCNVGLNKVDSLANRIRLEAVVRLGKNANVNTGDVITLSGSINANDRHIMIKQQDLNVVDTFTDILPDNMTLINETAIKLNITDDPIIMKIHEEKTIPFHLIIPQHLTARVTVDVDLPLNDSAVMTFKELKVTGSGVNLAGYGNDPLVEEMTFDPKSSRNTSQINKVIADMGIITNSGVTTDIDEEQYDDNVVRMDLTVVMADSAINENNAEVWISVGIKIGIFIVISEFKVKIERGGTEKPCIEFTGQVDAGNSTDAKVVLNGLLRHSNESTAEGTSMTAFILFPPFLQFKEVTSMNDSHVTCNNVNDVNMLKITCDWFFFTDVISFTAVLEQSPTYKVPTSLTGNDAVITLATASTMHRSSDEFSCNMNYINHTVTVTAQASSNCTAVPLGMASSSIKDCQISGSTDFHAGGDPKNARPGGTGFWPFVRKGTLKTQRYLQVYLGNKATIQKIVVGEGTPNTGFGSKVNKIQPYFSNDGYAWMPGNEISVGPTFPYDAAVGSAIASRYVRVYILDDTDDTKKLGVTFEFHGCYTTTDIATSDMCKGVMEEPVTNAEWYRSGFLNNGPNTYVCDAKIQDGLKQSCFKTADGDSWEKMDDRLSCMIGMDTATSEIYALGSDGRSYLSSTDQGVTWSNVRVEKFNEVKAMASFKGPVKMKWEESANLAGADPVDPYKDGAWGVTYEGVHKDGGGGSWDVRLNWASCCGN